MLRFNGLRSHNKEGPPIGSPIGLHHPLSDQTIDEA